MEQKHNVVGWFEIPVTNMGRAIRFYEEVFEFKLEQSQMGMADMAFFPWVEGSMGSPGALVYLPDLYKPSSDGTVIYFTAFSGDLNNELSRVEKAGGKILEGKKLIKEEIGYMAIILDTEGNKIALHSRA
ncbi:MAG: VOC family protein [Bacteroidota bacterium]|nr:VOC family protein [Bacteroidota bacterium]